MKRILVTYATRAGSTVGAGEAIAQSLRAAGHTVDLRPIKDVSDVKDYDALVIGSAIHMGNWLPEAMDWPKKNRAALNRVPTAIFSVHMLNLDDSPASRQARLKYTAPVRALVTPKAEAFFAGKMEYAKLAFFDRMIALLVAKLTGSKEGDYRDWAVIQNWAASLAPMLGVAAS